MQAHYIRDAVTCAIAGEQRGQHIQGQQGQLNSVRREEEVCINLRENACVI